jgi:hypothetical protein
VRLWRTIRPRSPLAALVLLVGLLGGGAVPAAHAADLTASDATPTVFFQDVDSGQIEWDIFVNGSALAIGDYDAGVAGRDVIRLTSSPNNRLSLQVDANGNVALGDGILFVHRELERVGIGTSAPDGNLHINGTSTQDVFSGLGPDLVNGPGFNFGYSGASFGRSSGFFNIRPDDLAVAPNPSLRFATADVQRMIITNTGNVGIGTLAPTNPLQMGSGAHVTAGGVWTDASSREVKQDIAPLSADAARVALEQLAPVTFAYRADPTEHHVGFVAEDVPDLVANADRKGLSPMDIVAVLTRVVQEQQAALAQVQAELAALRRAMGR